MKWQRRVYNFRAELSKNFPENLMLTFPICNVYVCARCYSAANI